ncbi:hypothetical protein [Paenibacillus medicaginis]|uniref:Uncharacterized protein n=1 Tax=Paenibacillus medicaginis TaxID=1470560 RepID=A0ABV5BVH2_9BACL
MSWDVSLVKDGHEEIDCGNYTYNVSPMYRRAMGFTIGDLHRRSAADVAIILTDGIITLTNKPALYKEMNPENGWGNYEGAINFLAQIVKNCLLYPDYELVVS